MERMGQSGLGCVDVGGGRGPARGGAWGGRADTMQRKGLEDNRDRKRM